MPCKAQDLATVKLFELLDEEELGELAAVIDSQILAAGETLFNAGDFGETLYIVNYGEVELSIKDTAGQKIVLKVAAEDDLFGEFVVWIAINTLSLGINQFDPYPFGLLTMIVSLEAIFLSCFVLISQNRQSQKDHIRSDIEYEVNIQAELEIAHLHEKTDHIHEQMLEQFAHIEKLLKKE